MTIREHFLRGTAHSEPRVEEVFSGREQNIPLGGSCGCEDVNWLGRCAHLSSRPDCWFLPVAGTGSDYHSLAVLGHLGSVLSKCCMSCRFVLVQRLMVQCLHCELPHKPPRRLVTSVWPVSSAPLQFLVDLGSEGWVLEVENCFYSLLNLSVWLILLKMTPLVPSIFVAKEKVSYFFVVIKALCYI